jgi:type IV pilus assembly protein PilC
MPVFAYKSINIAGALRDSKIDAPSEAHARALLQNKGERVIQIREVSRSKFAGERVKARGRKPSADEVASTIRQMSILVRAGVPLVEGLHGLADQATSMVLRRTLETVALDVSQGSALSDAFAQHPHTFPNLAVEMVRIAEAGGDLAESLSRLAEHLESSAEIGRKVKSALAYPAVIVCLSVVTVVVMVTFILPRFMKLFDKMGAKLPWSTKALMSVSYVLTHNWYLFAALGVGLFLLVKRMAQGRLGRRRIDSILLKAPVIGDVVNKVVLGRVMASMSTLLGSGVPMVQALRTSAAAANNEIVREALLKASDDVAEGSATSQALRVSGVFPALVIQMVASGEKTGELPSMLDYVCKMYARETDAKMKSLTSIIEPILIVFLGIVVGFIAMSVIVPIYSLVGGVK